MARNALGSLIVRLGLDAAEFTSGLSAAEFKAKQFGERVGTVIGKGVGLAITSIATASVAAVYAIDRLTKQTAQFKDLEERTGATAESIAGMSVAADVAGTSIGDVATFSERLSKQLASVEDGSKGVGLALKALNINVAEFKKLDPASQLERLAKAQSEFADGGGKTAAFESLARNGSQMLPFLKELEQQGGRQVLLTQEQIEQADRYADAQARAKATLGQYAQVIASESLPAITAVTTATKEFVGELIGVSTESNKLKSNTAVRDFAEDAAKSLAFIVDAGDAVSRIFRVVGNVIGATAAQIRALASGDFKAYNAIQNDASRTIDDIIAKEQFSAKLARQIAAQREDDAKRANQPAAKPKPQVDFNFGVKAKDDGTARRLLDGQLKDLERAVREEQELLRDRAHFLGEYYRDSQISTADYYLARRQYIEEALQNEIELYNQEEAALRKHAAAASTKPAERIGDEEKIREVIDKRTKAERDAAIAGRQLSIDQRRALKEYGIELEAVALQVKELQGDTVGAGIGRLLQQQRTDRERAAAEGDVALTAQLDKIVALTRAQLQLNEATNSYSRVQLSINNAQQRIDLLQQTGAITELDAINKRAQLSRDRIGQLRAEADEVERLALAMEKSTFRDDQLLRVEQMRIAIDQLAAQADVLNRKFNDIGANAFADALSSVVTGAKSAKQAIKDFEKSVVASITNIASKNIGEYLFGKDGPLGGFGRLLGGAFGGKGGDGSEGAVTEGAGGLSGFLRDMFGGGGKSGGGAVAASSLTTAGAGLSTSAIELTTAAAALQAAASSLGLSSTANGASGLGGLFGSGSGGGGFDWFNGSATDFFGAGGGIYANGGNPPIGKVSLVGERGPELFVPRVAGTIIPNHKLGRGGMGGGVTNITINVPPGTSRQSAEQVALHAGRQLSHVLRRRN